MKYLFGPVNSRRLGLSLGLDLLPANICNFNCVYCEVGATRLLTCERKEYSPTGEIIAEIDLLLADPTSPLPDAFTVTATGEPTLHLGIGAVIRHLKAQTDRPVAVLTNGTLLWQPEVRNELAAADIVIPSLDAARTRSYHRVNRPAPGMDLEKIISGLACFRREFAGQIWLEILLVKGLNDSDEDIEALQKAAARIGPHRIQLNTVVRPPLESFAAPLLRREMEEIAGRLPGRVEILVDFNGQQRNTPRQPADREILEMVSRRPGTLQDICEALNLEGEPARHALSRLKDGGHLTTRIHNDREYYQINRNERRTSGKGSAAETEMIDSEQTAASRLSAAE
jgi:wyosine [tRNA(Phe)-imidazoG37] synthetase (radical SAM superfamily)